MACLECKKYMVAMFLFRTRDLSRVFIYVFFQRLTQGITNHNRECDSGKIRASKVADAVSPTAFFSPYALEHVRSGGGSSSAFPL